MEIRGEYNTAKVFTDNIEESAVEQIRSVCDAPYLQDCKIRIMPDVHAGKGCTIGTTMTLGAAVIPNLVGVDIGCGMEVMRLNEEEVDLARLDEIIRKNIPAGREVREGRFIRFPALQELHCYRSLTRSKRIERSVGTLGGGNHFIELDRDEEGRLYLVVHSGSRNLGKQVAEIYQSLAYDLACGREEYFAARDALIAEYKAVGRRSEIQSALTELRVAYKAKASTMPAGLEPLYGRYYEEYMHDMKIAQAFAALNRKTIVSVLAEKMQFTAAEQFTTVHNYIDVDSKILRKGAVSAREGEKLIIPMNMRDGSLLCVGKGNEDWNYSAPHGAGRLLSRAAAREQLTVEEYAASMQGIYTTSVSEDTIDESPAAYKSMDEILSHVGGTVEVVSVIKPVYNFKAGE